MVTECFGLWVLGETYEIITATPQKQQVLALATWLLRPHPAQPQLTSATGVASIVAASYTCMQLLPSGLVTYVISQPSSSPAGRHRQTQQIEYMPLTYLPAWCP
jgi:hypothetical protein